MRDALRPILSCALTVAISAAVHGQMVGTKFEKYTRFLTALILLSLLLTPMLNLFRAGGALFEQEDRTDQTVQPSITFPEMSYSEALLTVLQRKVEDDVRLMLKSEYGISPEDILSVQVAIDGSDPEAIRVESVQVRIHGNADPEEIGKTLKERYGCEKVSVMVDA